MKTNYRVRDLLCHGRYGYVGVVNHYGLFRACIRKILKDNCSSVTPVMGDIYICKNALRYCHADFVHIYWFELTWASVSSDRSNTTVTALVWNKVRQ